MHANRYSSVREHSAETPQRSSGSSFLPRPTSATGVRTATLAAALFLGSSVTLPGMGRAAECVEGDFCANVDYSSCGSITGGDNVALQCCLAHGNVEGQVVEIDGYFLLDQDGPNCGRMQLPTGTTLRSTLADPGHEDVCARSPNATIDNTGLALTGNPFGAAALTMGAGSTAQNILMQGGLSTGHAMACLNLAPDASALGVATDDCFQGARLVVGDESGQEIHATIKDSCFTGGFSSVGLTAGGWPAYSVDGQHLSLDLIDSKLTGSFWSLGVFGGANSSYGHAELYMQGTTISNSGDSSVRVVGGQDINCCTAENTVGGNFGSSKLVLGPGNTIKNSGASGISIEAGVRGGSALSPDTSSHNTSTLVLACETEFDGNTGADVRMIGTWEQGGFPDQPVGVDNQARLVGISQSHLDIETHSCLGGPEEGCEGRIGFELEADDRCNYKGE